eukprot:COSAG06_NODE_6223_length_3036_cov_3.014641_5_plen_73_part_00
MGLTSAAMANRTVNAYMHGWMHHALCSLSPFYILLLGSRLLYEFPLPILQPNGGTVLLARHGLQAASASDSR